MNKQTIDKNIYELENADTTFSNCQKLASLYIVRYFNENALNRMIGDVSQDNVQEELLDILPSYKQYCHIKREYQLNHIAEEAVLNCLQLLCREITEFLHLLYSSTDLPDERAIIEGNLSNIQF